MTGLPTILAEGIPELPTVMDQIEEIRILKGLEASEIQIMEQVVLEIV